MQSDTTEVNFNSNCYLYICATRFGLYLGHPQACQYKNLTKEDTILHRSTSLHHHHLKLYPGL